MGGGRSSWAATRARSSATMRLHRVRVQVGVLGTGTDVPGEEPRLVLQASRELDRHPAERRQLDAPRVREVGRRAEQVLLVLLGVPRHQPADLQLQEHGADRQEPRRLLQVPPLGLLRVGEVSVGDGRDRDVAHVHLLLHDQLGQQSERAREDGQVDGEASRGNGAGSLIRNASRPARPPSSLPRPAAPSPPPRRARRRRDRASRQAPHVVPGTARAAR